MKLFQRKKENFICEKCSQEVIGNGYTNHCPTCLWSKHVDINPGDREAQCHGLMKPIFVEKEKDDFVITHQCQKCSHQKRNKISKEDNFDEVIKITSTLN